MVKLAVIGAGPMGLASAVKIKEKYRDIDVLVIAKKFSPNTTADGAGGLWYPYLCGATSDELITKWSMETYKLYHELWIKGGSDVCMMPFYALSRKPKQPPCAAWTQQVLGFNHLTEKQLQYFSELHSSAFVQGHTFTTFVVTSTTILQLLTARLLGAGGKLLKAKVTSLDEPILDPYDVIVNCTGLKARELVKDERVFPIRGQLAMIKAPWVTYTLIDDDGDNYIIPNVRVTALGGTHQENDYNTDTDRADGGFILNGCTHLMPGLTHAQMVREWAGLRPARDVPRLEAEPFRGKLILHNYGHGGSGMTFFWGCAADVLRLMERNLFDVNGKPENPVSKL